MKKVNNKALLEALLSVFKRTEQLEIFVRQNLDTNLDHIARGRSGREIASRLIAWAESSGYLVKLIDGLKDAYPDNSEVKVLVATLDQWPEDKDSSARLVIISEGPFWFGVAQDDWDVRPSEHPGNEEYLPTFSIAKYPVTCAEYARFMEDQSRKAPWGGSGNPPNWMSDHPVTRVSFDEAKAYCKWLSSKFDYEFDLPTEMQWVKAARGELPSQKIYTWGNQWIRHAANTKEIKATCTRSVYSSDTNISEYGVCDLLGNVWEWTHFKNGLVQLREKRVVCGGSWKSDKGKTKISSREEVALQTKRDDIGFRIIKKW